MTGVFSNRLPAIMALVLVLALLPVLAACGDDGAPSTSLPPGGDEPARKVTITVGNLSDLTGPAAAAMTVINMALEDIVRYYNDEDLIPGIALKVVTYDGQYRPSNNIPGYEWLKERGADLIFSAVPGTPETLKPFVDSDRMVLFGASASPEGYL
ncbi:MAG: ABC transporter substrate-binding protein, partial [Chloroflexi bacterium]|nr:ABC transporter substrate-binding protein [Chloroflexota bacterium]